MSCRSVLIIDDDKDIRNALRDALEMEGYTVHTAVNGQDALNFLTQGTVKKPGCIILDMAMPIMNGPEFLKHIETEYKKEFGEIPVIVASANLGHTDPAAIKHAKAKINKPMDLGELYDAIEHYCGRPSEIK